MVFFLLSTFELYQTLFMVLHLILGLFIYSTTEILE